MADQIIHIKMKRIREYISNDAFGIIAALLILLFVYAALSKLLNYERFTQQMLNQVFPNDVAKILVWVVPSSELIVSGFLSFGRSRLYGLWLSLGLLSLFTGYIALVKLNVFDRVPCSCGGILEHMGYGTHLVFNLFFLLLTIIGIRIHYRERRIQNLKK